MLGLPGVAVTMPRRRPAGSRTASAPVVGRVVGLVAANGGHGPYASGHRARKRCGPGGRPGDRPPLLPLQPASPTSATLDSCDQSSSPRSRRPQLPAILSPRPASTRPHPGWGSRRPTSRSSTWCSHTSTTCPGSRPKPTTASKPPSASAYCDNALTAAVQIAADLEPSLALGLTDAGGDELADLGEAAANGPTVGGPTRSPAAGATFAIRSFEPGWPPRRTLSSTPPLTFTC